MWGEASPYIAVGTAAWILSSQRCAQPTAWSLTLLPENRREAKGNSHHPVTDKDEETNIFKILLVQPKSSCLSLLANLHVPFVPELARSVPVWQNMYSKLALNILVRRSPSGCDSATHLLCLSGRHERVGAAHNVWAISLHLLSYFLATCPVTDSLRGWM